MKIKLQGGPMDGRVMDIAGDVLVTQFPLVSRFSFCSVYVIDKENLGVFKYIGLRKKHPTKTIQQEFNEGLLG